MKQKILFLVFIVFICGNLFSQYHSFEKITTLAQIEDGKNYIIGVEGIDYQAYNPITDDFYDMWINQTIVMTSENIPDDGEPFGADNRLMWHDRGLTQTGKVSGDMTSNYVWTITKNGIYYTIKSLNGGRILQMTEDSSQLIAHNVELSSPNFSQWQITVRTDETFKIMNRENTTGDKAIRLHTEDPRHDYTPTFGRNNVEAGFTFDLCIWKELPGAPAPSDLLNWFDQAGTMGADSNFYANFETEPVGDVTFHYWINEVEFPEIEMEKSYGDTSFVTNENIDYGFNIDEENIPFAMKYEVRVNGVKSARPVHSGAAYFWGDHPYNRPIPIEFVREGVAWNDGYLVHVKGTTTYGNDLFDPTVVATTNNFNIADDEAGIRIIGGTSRESFTSGVQRYFVPVTAKGIVVTEPILSIQPSSYTDTEVKFVYINPTELASCPDIYSPNNETITKLDDVNDVTFETAGKMVIIQNVELTSGEVWGAGTVVLKKDGEPFTAKLNGLYQQTAIVDLVTSGAFDIRGVIEFDTTRIGWYIYPVKDEVGDIAAGGTLPIPLLNTSISSTYISGVHTVKIHWETPSAIDYVSHYLVERSLDDTFARVETFTQPRLSSTNLNIFYDFEQEVEEGTYYYRIVAVANDGTKNQSLAMFVRVTNAIDGYIPNVTRIIGLAYPNPIRANSDEPISVRANIKKGETATFRVYNVKGQLVHENSNIPSGEEIKTIEWNKKDQNNRTVSSGIYFYQVKSQSSSSNIEKMLIVR